MGKARVFLIGVITLLATQSARAEEWRMVEHEVEYQQTLRSIALRYLGDKRGVFCLQGQLGLENPNYITAGQVLHFLAPSKPMTYEQLASPKLKCSPNQIFWDDEQWYPEKPKVEEVVEVATPPPAEVVVEPPPAPPSIAPTPPVEVVHMRGSLKLGGGLGYSSINQSSDNSIAAGGSKFKSFRVPNVLAEGRFDWGERLRFEGAWDSVPGHLDLPDTAASSEGTYRWEAYHAFLEFKPRRLHFTILRMDFEPGFRLGYGKTAWPLLDFPDTSNVHVNYIHIGQVKAGLGTDIQISEHWESYVALHWLSPVANDFGTVKFNYGFDGYFQIQRQCFGQWSLGLDWRGRVAEIKFSSASTLGQTQVFSSAASLYLSRNFN